MRILSVVNFACYVLCVLAIVVGSTLSIFAIWSDFDNDLMWKGISTSMVLFAAGVLTIGVNNIIGSRVVVDPSARGAGGPLPANGSGTPGAPGGAERRGA
jgi:hypothetical protein